MNCTRTCADMRYEFRPNILRNEQPICAAATYRQRKFDKSRKMALSRYKQISVQLKVWLVIYRMRCEGKEHIRTRLA